MRASLAIFIGLVIPCTAVFALCGYGWSSIAAAAAIGLLIVGLYWIRRFVFGPESRDSDDRRADDAWWTDDEHLANSAPTQPLPAPKRRTSGTPNQSAPPRTPVLDPERGWYTAEEIDRLNSRSRP